MLAILMAAALRFGTVTRPVSDVDIHRDVDHVSATPAELAHMKKWTVDGIDVYTQSLFNVENGANATLRVVIRGIRFDDDADADRAPAAPRVSLLRPGLLRIDQDRSLVGGNAYDEMTTTLVVDARQAKPRVVSIHTDAHVGGGACTGHANAFSPQTTFSCSWDDARDDFVCTEGRILANDWSTRTGWKRFTLFGGEALTRASDLRDANELLTREHPNVVAGRGAVERVAISPSLDAFLIPPVGHPFMLGGWIVDRKKAKVLPLTPMLIASPTEELILDYDMREDGYTPDREPIEVRVMPPVSTTITPIEIRDGNAHATFWLGYDGTTAQLLCVSTDAGEYDRCGNVIHPPTATRIDGMRVHVDDDCSFDATIRWAHGFVVEPPPECGPADVL